MKQYYLSVFPGLAGVAQSELQARLGLKSGPVRRLRNAELLPVGIVNPKELLSLRTVEDVYLQLGSISLTGAAFDLKALEKAAVFLGPLTSAASVYAQARGPLPARPQFRIVVQADDVKWRSYRRLDIQKAAEAAILRSRSTWRLTREEAPVEIWLQQVSRELLVSLRLTTGAHRSRSGRAVEREAALRPTIAAAMAWLSGPEDSDTVLDPMCGSGTILLERAGMGRYSQLLGGDNDAAAVKAALTNFGPRHQPRRIERWDARTLPLENASVDKIVCNLPWGRQIGRPEALPALYGAALTEMVRVLRPGGRMVLLTSEWELLKRVIKDRRGLVLQQTVSNVEILGRRADIFVLGLR